MPSEKPEVFYLKQRDLEHDIDLQLFDDDGNPYNLTGAGSVTFKMARQSDYSSKISQPMNVLDAPQGIVRYSWQEGDTDEKGQFYAEVRVVDSTGQPITFPSDGYIIIMIGQQLP